jgi:hypothetical protein
VLSPGGQRWDRRHALMSELRQYFPFQQERGSGWLDLRYQYVRELGWDDLWIRSRGRVSWGASSFHDDLSMGEYLRALFGDQFVPSAVNFQIEYRFSLARDLLKLSVFHDLVLFAERDPTARSVAPQMANGFGPGVHILAGDLLQVDAYLALGFRGSAELGAAFWLQLQKAF